MICYDDKAIMIIMTMMKVQIYMSVDAVYQSAQVFIKMFRNTRNVFYNDKAIMIIMRLMIIDEGTDIYVSGRS